MCMCDIVTLSNYLKFCFFSLFACKETNREGRDTSQRCMGKDKRPWAQAATRQLLFGYQAKPLAHKSGTAVGQAPERRRISICGDFPLSAGHSPKPPDQVLECKSRGRAAETPPHLIFSVILSLGKQTNKQTNKISVGYAPFHVHELN